MVKFKLQIDSDALQDIQNTTDWYNEQSAGLGSRFQKQVKHQIASLKTKGEFYSGDTMMYVACLLKNFHSPFIYIIEDSTVKIFAVLHASRNPLIWKERRK